MKVKRLRCCNKNKFLVLIFFSFLVQKIFCIGLSTPYSIVSIENIPVGIGYNLKNVNFIYKVQNTSENYKLRINLSVVIPSKDVLRKGYKPILSESWVELIQKEFILAPKETAETEIIIKIPNEKKFYNKKFQFDICAESSIYGADVGDFITPHLAVESIFLITTAKTKHESSEGFLEKENISFTLEPTDLVVDSVEVGKTIKLSEITNKKILVKNISPQKILIKLEIVRPKNTHISFQQGYKYLSNKFISFSNNEIELMPNETKEVDLIFNFPDNKKYRSKKFQYLAHIFSEGKKTSYAQFLNILISTK